MKCETIQDYLFQLMFAGNEREEICFQRFVKRLLITLHLLHCENCGEFKRVIGKTSEIMASDFLPQSEVNTEVSDAVMNIINRQNSTIADLRPQQSWSEPDTDTFSLQTWVVSGLIIMISLLSAYFSINLLSSQEILDFIVPIAITIGSVITAYGAIFIGTHLKELSKRFGISV
ncbi:MAG: hypothetical protein Ta2B_28380 [Termitinemataceae bacterium]|nr:MAG: hypothetical protein Ta2B_28380 [Termitinemataceae bacterium]